MTNQPVILVVDDQPLNNELLEAHLVPAGYRVLAAEDGEAALKIVAENAVDLVLLDVMMPKIDGFEVCRRIKADEALRSIPVVLITALAAKEDRIKGIDAGAEDFITKPFDKGEVLARVKMLLRLRAAHTRLQRAYDAINSLTSFGETHLQSFDPLTFNFLAQVDDIVRQVIRKAGTASDKPDFVVVGVPDERRAWRWYQYQFVSSTLSRRPVAVDIDRVPDAAGQARIAVFNQADRDQPEFQALAKTLASLSVVVSDMVCCLNASICIFALNYGREVTRYDAAVLNSLVMQSMFLKSLSGQIRETESAFGYTIHALARASEANDEDTGNHILRVGEYCALMAEGLGMPAEAVEALRLQATLHDVGKIHVHPDILRKPGPLTPGEWVEIKKHTVHGPLIIGNHPRLGIASTVAGSHHERWDGGGYPLGLRGAQIPVVARVLNIADQYDALRNERSYKRAYDHLTTYLILTEGDGRTLPGHFDPEILRLFKKHHGRFEEIYERRTG